MRIYTIPLIDTRRIEYLRDPQSRVWFAAVYHANGTRDTSITTIDSGSRVGLLWAIRHGFLVDVSLIDPTALPQ